MQDRGNGETSVEHFEHVTFEIGAKILLPGETICQGTVVADMGQGNYRVKWEYHNAVRPGRS